jgi:hypothetical protein
VDQKTDRQSEPFAAHRRNVEQAEAAESSASDRIKELDAAKARLIIRRDEIRVALKGPIALRPIAEVRDLITEASAIEAMLANAAVELQFEYQTLGIRRQEADRARGNLERKERKARAAV